MKIIILVVSLFAYASAESNISCDKGWELIGNKCYLDFQPTPYGEEELLFRTCCDRPQGEAICDWFGAHLADIKSISQQENIVGWLESINSTDVWIGLWSPTPGGDKLFHTDRSPLDPAKASWSSTGRNEEVQCVRMHEARYFNWSDRPCSWKYGVLCEKDAAPVKGRRP